MKVIAIAAVTADGKTTVNEIKKQLSNVQSLHFMTMFLHSCDERESNGASL